MFTLKSNQYNYSYISPNINDTFFKIIHININANLLSYLQFCDGHKIVKTACNNNSTLNIIQTLNVLSLNVIRFHYISQSYYISRIHIIQIFGHLKRKKSSPLGVNL